VGGVVVESAQEPGRRPIVDACQEPCLEQTDKRVGIAAEGSVAAVDVPQPQAALEDRRPLPGDLRDRTCVHQDPALEPIEVEKDITDVCLRIIQGTRREPVEIGRSGLAADLAVRRPVAHAVAVVVGRAGCHRQAGIDQGRLCAPALGIRQVLADVKQPGLDAASRDLCGLLGAVPDLGDIPVCRLLPGLGLRVGGGSRREGPGARGTSARGDEFHSHLGCRGAAGHGDRAGVAVSLWFGPGR